MKCSAVRRRRPWPKSSANDLLLAHLRAAIAEEEARRRERWPLWISAPIWLVLVVGSWTAIFALAHLMRQAF